MEQQIILEKSGMPETKVVEWVRKWGDVNTDGLLDESSQVFALPDVEGFIGYKIESQNAIVFGDPVCAPQDKARLALAFEEECRRLNLGRVYTIVSEEFTRWALKNQSAIAVEFGTKFLMDPKHNPMENTGNNGVLVRKKVKQALREGVEIREYFGEDPATEQQLQDVADQWLGRRHGPQIYLCSVALFKYRQGKRWIYAVHQGKVVGLLVLNELQYHKGWLLNNVMTVENAPKGLSELLIISALEILNKEGCRFVLAGPVPLHILGEINGIGDFGEALIRFGYKMAKLVFHLEGHSTFWDKFQPRHEKSYLLFPEKNLRYSSIKGLMNAYNVTKG